MLQQNTPKPEPAAQPVKRTIDSGADAKELAKILIKSGKMSLIKDKNSKEKQSSGFKRSKAHERRRCVFDKAGGYTPFHNVGSTDEELGNGKMFVFDFSVDYHVIILKLQVQTLLGTLVLQNRKNMKVLSNLAIHIRLLERKHSVKKNVMVK